jgi:catechol 2,3-dioxygenase-like lactoylglutathione lyase family enzyme
MVQTVAIERVAHTGIRVRDLDRALAFYRVLGFTLSRRAGVARIFFGDIHQDVRRGVTGIGIEDKVDFDALRVADDCYVVALRAGPVKITMTFRSP